MFHEEDFEFFEVGEEFIYNGNDGDLIGERGVVLKIYPPDTVRREQTYRCKVVGYSPKKRLPPHKMIKIKPEIKWEV